MNLYQFTHRTFLEYFTADYLNGTNPTPDRLLKILLPKIAKQEWDVVTQLAFQIQNKSSEEAGDELLNILIDRANTASEDEKPNLLDFAARCLEFIVPSPPITKHITKACFEYSLNWGIKRLTQQNFDVHNNDRIQPRIILAHLFNATLEILSFADRTILEQLVHTQFHSIKNNKIPWLDRVYCLLFARFLAETRDEVQLNLDSCGFTEEQQAFIWRWVRREIDFVGFADDR